MKKKPTSNIGELPTLSSVCKPLYLLGRGTSDRITSPSKRELKYGAHRHNRAIATLREHLRQASITRAKEYIALARLAKSAGATFKQTQTAYRGMAEAEAFAHNFKITKGWRIRK